MKNIKYPYRQVLGIGKYQNQSTRIALQKSDIGASLHFFKHCYKKKTKTLY